MEMEAFKYLRRSIEHDGSSERNQVPKLRPPHWRTRGNGSRRFQEVSDLRLLRQHREYGRLLMERRCDGCGIYQHETELRLFKNGWIEVGLLLCEEDATSRGIDWDSNER